MDERHTRVAMRLEADVQVAAEKVAGARAATEAAKAKFVAAREAMQSGLELIVAAKDEAIADMANQWEAATRAVGELAATAACVRPVPADDVPFLLADTAPEEQGDPAGGGSTTLTHARPGSREKHAAYEREAAEARRMLARREGGESEFAALEDAGARHGLTAHDSQRLQSAATLTMVLEDRIAESRRVTFGAGSRAGGLGLAVPGAPHVLQTGTNGSGLWTPQLTQGRFGGGAGTVSTRTGTHDGGCLPSQGGIVGGSAGRATPKPRGGSSHGVDDPLLSTVARVFDAAAAASAMGDSRGGGGGADGDGSASRGGWDSGTWRPEQSGSYTGMQQRRQAHESRSRAEREAKASGQVARELAVALEGNVSEAKLVAAAAGAQSQHPQPLGGRPPRRA